jgi:hypothetical protein
MISSKPLSDILTQRHSYRDHLMCKDTNPRDILDNNGQNTIPDQADMVSEIQEPAPFCVSLTEQDKQSILVLQAFKKVQYGRHIKIKTPCCLEEWQKQLKREDDGIKVLGEDYQLCDCGCSMGHKTINLLT